MLAMTAARTVVRVIAAGVGAIFFLPALLVFLFGLLIFGDELDKTTETTGTIVAPPGPRSSTSAAPDDFGAGTCVVVVEFVVDGRPFTAESSDSTAGNCDRTVGETVAVHYDPSDPDENTVGSSNAKLTGVLMMAGAGVWGAIALGIVWLVFRGTRPAVVPGPALAMPPPGVPPAVSSPAVSSPAPSGPIPSSAVPAPVPAVVWDPSDTGVRPERPGWYPTGDGTIERWYNGLSWSDATRQPPS